MSTFKIENCSVLHQTDFALLVESENFDSEDGQEWIPQSVIHENSEVWKLGTEGDLLVSDWFAKKKGWY
jgi:hypothetical protein